VLMRATPICHPLPRMVPDNSHTLARLATAVDMPPFPRAQARGTSTQAYSCPPAQPASWLPHMARLGTWAWVAAARHQVAACLGYYACHPAPHCCRAAPLGSAHHCCCCCACCACCGCAPGCPADPGPPAVGCTPPAQEVHPSRRRCWRYAPMQLAAHGVVNPHQGRGDQHSRCGCSCCCRCWRRPWVPPCCCC
jgi:hypothetical protein